MPSSSERIAHLPWDANLVDYSAQATALWMAYRADDPGALLLFQANLPLYLDPEVTWLPLGINLNTIRDARHSLEDARLVVARAYSYLDWEALEAHVTAVNDAASPVRLFERASEAMITGDLTTLRDMLAGQPELVHARSVRATCHEPSIHAATLLHYSAANGIEGYRQKSPVNAEAIARALLTAGAEADALAGMYGGQCATLSMLVSSSPPADANVQVPLVHALIDHGANPDGAGEGAWQSNVVTALVFGFVPAAEALVARGARVDTLVKAAGLGRVDAAREMLTGARAEERHQALALAATCGQTEVVRLLVESGEDPNRFNPDGFHSHATPLHSAVSAGHLDVVKLLITLGARPEIEDTIWHSDALGWAEHGEQRRIAGYLKGLGFRA